jgi:hypothetical protein
MHKKQHKLPIRLLCIYSLVILFVTTGFSAFSQETIKDTLLVKKQVTVHSPRKATIYSAVLPGLGQIYNKKYWKLPIVYGGFATLGYFINFNNSQYITYRQAYSDFIDGDPNTNSFLRLINNPNWLTKEKEAQLTTNLRSAKDYWRRNRDLVVIGTFVFYAANIIDASVDANFFNFNVNNDLTINWVPEPMMCMDEKLIGIHCIITF